MFDIVFVPIASQSAKSLLIGVYVLLQLALWTWESRPMTMLIQFVKTRWLSKFGMLRSLLVNKSPIRVMCASEDDECKALRGADLSDGEWRILEVRSISVFSLAFCFIRLHPCSGSFGNS